MDFFRTQLSLCGLSVDEAAQFLAVERRRVRAWARNIAPVPTHVLRRLSALYSEQEDVADEIVQRWEEAGRPAEFKFAVSATDEEARGLGWPSVSAQMIPAAIAQTVIAPVRIECVPLGVPAERADVPDLADVA
ncbi:MAG: hypothetical protein AAFV19_16005 [Pseudomonadota bacterium]